MAFVRFAFVVALGCLLTVGESAAREVQVHVSSSPNKKLSASSRGMVDSGSLSVQGSDSAKRFGAAYLAGDVAASRIAAGGDFTASQKMKVHVATLSGWGGSMVESTYATVHITSVSK